MDLALLPQPRSLRKRKGTYALPSVLPIGLPSQAWTAVADDARVVFARVRPCIAVAGVDDAITVQVDLGLAPEDYRLRIGATGIVIEAARPAGARHAVRTLAQIVQQSDPKALPCLAIEDGPAFADRGVYYDVCRGRVPKRERLVELVDGLAAHKVNQLQLYVEHTFAFRRHPKIGRGASPLTAEDILALDQHCADRGVELVPSLASFGHLATVLTHPEYRHLAEDRGVGQYDDPEADTKAPNRNLRGWTLSPACPESYDFLDSLFAEYLPLFRSERFNVCCDETWDLGLGQSYRLCQRKGKGRVYLDHVCRLREIAARYGKRIQFWGDIIRHYPELIEAIPEDVTVLDWGYGHQHDFDAARDFEAAGLPYYVCPGTNGWNSLFPRVSVARDNIAGFAAAGARHGAQGLLNTDWGDGGHYNFMELSWHGYLFGAEQAWNPKANHKDFDARFARAFLHSDDDALPDAITRFGDLSSLLARRGNRSAWQAMFFSLPDADIFRDIGPEEVWIGKNGTMKRTHLRLNAAFAADARKTLAEIRAVFDRVRRDRGADPLGILPYWLYALDCTDLAAERLATFGPDGTDTPARRRALAKRMTALQKRFEKLWIARNRRSEIRITMRYFRDAIRALG